MPDRPPDVVRDRAVRLFTFLRELTELRTRTIRSWEQYEQTVWFQDIPREPGCHCIAWPRVDLDAHAEAWVEVTKPRLKAPPKPPALVIPWINLKQVSDSTRESPEIREQITVEVATRLDDGSEEVVTQVQQLSERPEVREAWQGYLAEQWPPWAEEDRRLQEVQAIYTDLFTIYQRQQRLGEAFEVVVGVGHLTRSGQSAVPVKRHLITARASISFDSNRGVITVGPAGEGARPTLEQDMLEPTERPDAIEQRAIEQQVSAIGDALWDRTQVQAALRSWVNAVSTEGRFEDTLDRQSEVSDMPIVHLSPAVILRRRTEQSFLRLFQEIIAQLRAGVEVPLGVRRLVEIVDDRAKGGVAAGETHEPTWSPSEIHFPLLANEEQLEIARKLAERQGVLVQGPPGTGKSHTIANLACHLLANGQRVLITSHTSRALKALLDRFRSDVSLTEIADLCVILLGDDLDAIEALEDSVRGISRRFKEWNPTRQDRVIADLEQRLDEGRRAEAATLARLRALREAETHQHTLGFGGYHGTAQAIALRLRREEGEYNWLSKTSVTDTEPPLSDDEALELLRLLRGISVGREHELGASWPSCEELIRPETFVGLLVAEREAKETYAQAEARRAHPAYATLVEAPEELRDALANVLEDLRGALETLLGRPERWVGEAARQILAGRSRGWAELASETRRHLTHVGEKARRVSGCRVVGLETRERGLVKVHATALLKHLEAGGRLRLPLFLPRPVREARYLSTSVILDGTRCDRPLTLRQLIEWIESAEGLETLRQLWSRHVEAIRGSFAEQIAGFEDLEDALKQILELEKKLSAVRSRHAMIPGLAEPVWHDLSQLRTLEGAIQAASVEEALRRVEASLSAVETTLRVALTVPSAHPVVAQLLAAVKGRDERAYGEGWATVTALQRDRETLERRDDLLGRLRRRAQELTKLLQEDFGAPVWDVRLQQLNAAWNWVRADRWLEGLVNGPGVEVLSGEATAQSQRVRELVRDLAAAKAWKHCFAPERFTEAVRQHLEAWAQAVRRIGRGTGPRAGLHRKAARDHMEQCRAAIPAWIMPLYRVAETVRPGVDMYDVVVVDEASQSGPEALFLHYLAKKIVVVGDDKQISPDFIGLERQDVDLLRQRHLTDIPHNDALGVETSFFDQAEIRFGGRIRLREHFRCMPEIIQFSNNLCYRTEPLIPLRQYGSSRLPPVVVRHVPDGYETGRPPKVVNRPEAEAIVAQIEACLQDPTYADKSMGVISLLGEGQAREIERLLLDRVGPEEMEKRQLVCGDAYAFQGTERDVMFLSLVVAPRHGGRIATLTSTRDERRFNVAASRARDQMWLFHTVTLNDLSPQCLRHKLLQYCQNPHVEMDAALGINLEELAALARGPTEARSAPPPFDSWFEVDVFLEVARRGYRVLPQYQFAGYFIDLLVEGMRGRLAVECDGDAWHGAERYEQDMARQRMLQRCGLSFWRVRGSAFTRDPAGALQELWEVLARARIYPAGVDPSAQPSGAGSVKGGTRPDGPAGNRIQSPSAASDHEEGEIGEADEDTEAAGQGDEGDGEDPGRGASGLPLFQPKTPQAVLPYGRWVPQPVPDPRTAGVDTILGPLVSIIETEGPMFCSLVYRIYVKAAGLQRVGREIRSILNRAVAAAVRRGLIAIANELGTRDQVNQVVRKIGVPPVRLRARGPRSFHDIPPSEVLALVKELRASTPTLEGEELLGAVLQVLEIGRTTSQIRERFAEILRRESSPGSS